MCGINGIILKKYDAQLCLRMEKMNEALVHRGPDTDGIKVIEEGKRIFGHRRLSIIDLDNRSAQPMVSSSGRWILTYNGEIYNFCTLKKNVDYPYKTESDTEVLLAYIENKGVEATLKICNGMFSFAAYDTWEHKLYLCRDRFGIKPLFYYRDSEKVVFSSEIKGILNSGLVEAVLDKESIDDYLGYRYVREPYTFFENISQVKAGTYLYLDDNWRIKENRYWDIPKDFNMEEVYDEASIKELLKKHIEEAVLKRTIADVPLGTYLSGGIDSSLLTAIVAGNSSSRVNTYTIGFSDLNEFAFSKMVAEQYETIHHEILMSPENYIDYMQNVISYKDAPLGVPNEVPLAIMSKKLKENITVVLSGEGADELMGGYGRIFRSPYDFRNRTERNDFYDYFIQKYEYVPREIRDNFLNVSFDRRKIFDDKVRQRFSERENEYNVFYFFHKYHVKGLLQRVDTTTMLTSVEARVPFLDHELVEFVYRNVPYELKLRWKNDAAKEEAKQMGANKYSEFLDIPKYLLKQIAYDYLPKDVIERKKVGFPVPLDKWRNELKTIFLEKGTSCDWLRFNSKESLIHTCNQTIGGSQMLWMFINIELFINMYFKKEWRW